MNKTLEQKSIDYKETFGDRVLRDLSAFANTEGGSVIIGVSKDGEIKGINLSNEELEKITERIVGTLGIHPDIEIEEVKRKKILKISVEKSRIPISFDGRYYERVGNTTREMKPERLAQFLLKGTNWDSLINEEAKFNEIDKETVKMFIKMAKSKGRMNVFDEEVDMEVLFEHLKLSSGGKLTNGAIILFGKDPQKYFLNAILRVIRLKDQSNSIGDRFISGNLFNQVFEGETAIKNFLNVRYDIKGLVREEIWDYPLPAIREALINALIHRDYFKWNVQTQVKIFNDYIWFYNIGGLPQGITLEDLKRPHSSVPRNPFIVHIFYLAGLIEEMGSGINRMINNMKSAQLPEPEFKEEMGGFSVRFYKDIYTEENLRKMDLNERQIKAVLYIKERGKITNREYQEINNCSRNTASSDLRDLIRKGVLKESGKRGAGAYYEIA